MKTTIEDMRSEAVKRMKLLKVPQTAIDVFSSGKIPVTVFSAELQSVLDPIHKKVLKCFYEEFEEKDSVIPYYITESWHYTDIVSILYVDANKENWIIENEDIAKNGIASIYSYCISEDFGELGSGIFSIEDGVLWRVG